MISDDEEPPCIQKFFKMAKRPNGWENRFNRAPVSPVGDFPTEMKENPANFLDPEMILPKMDKPFQNTPDHDNYGNPPKLDFLEEEILINWDNEEIGDEGHFSDSDIVLPIDDDSFQNTPEHKIELDLIDQEIFFNDLKQEEEQLDFLDDIIMPNDEENDWEEFGDDTIS